MLTQVVAAMWMKHKDEILPEWTPSGSQGHFWGEERGSVKRQTDHLDHGRANKIKSSGEEDEWDLRRTCPRSLIDLHATYILIFVGGFGGGPLSRNYGLYTTLFSAWDHTSRIMAVPSQISTAVNSPKPTNLLLFFFQMQSLNLAR